MKKYILNLISEKGYDLEDVLKVEKNGEDHFVPVALVVDAILKMDKKTQGQIRDKLVMIDFANGDIRDFLKYIVAGLV